MADTKTTLTWLLRDQVSGTAKQINGQLDAMGVKAKGASGIMAELGNVTGGLISPTTLGATAVLGLGAALVTSVKASIAQEESYRRLGTSLKANVEGWNGDTRAVDDALVSTEQWSAFAKDDLRNSLAQLVGATHNVKDALDVQSVAMDLARYKGISLQDATDALTRVEGGSYRILKSLGIELPKTATQVQALAAVEAVAAGQAKDYGDSHAAALDKISNTWNDTVANVGGAVVNFSDVISNALDPSRIPNPFVHIPNQSEIMARAVISNQKDIDASVKITTALIEDMGRVMDKTARLSIEDATTVWLASRGQLPAANKKPPKPVTGSSGSQARASGGPVEEGQSYTVGEGGRTETLTMFAGGGGYVTPHGGSGFTIQGVSEAQLVAMVDRGLYFKLARASASATRK